MVQFFCHTNFEKNTINLNDKAYRNVGLFFVEKSNFGKNRAVGGFNNLETSICPVLF